MAGDRHGICASRDLEDTHAMIAASRPGACAVVIGGGIPGLEATAGMAARGVGGTVIHLMECRLDPAAAHLPQKNSERRSIRITHA